MLNSRIKYALSFLFLYASQLTCATTTREMYIIQKKGTVHQSPYSEPETTCSGKPCNMFKCAATCRATEGCVVFSHNPTHGTCILSKRPDDDTGDYETASPDWTTYYRDCPRHKGYELYDSHRPPLCLRLVNELHTQPDARAVCQQDDADLVRVKSQEVYDIAQAMLVGLGQTDYVFAGAEDGQTEGEFYWNDGTRLLQGTSVWRHSSEGYIANEDCVAFSYVNKLIDTTCYSTKAFMCQYDI